MKLHDAIKEAMLSKTRIRRSSWEEGTYRKVGYGGYSAWYTTYNEEEVLADDWIVEELALKPCPLCGSAVEVDELTADPEKGGLPELGKVWIQCSNPKCIINIEETLRFTTKKEFIKKWNTRA